jgi:Predicted membrane protein (DUF2231)
MSLPDPLHPAVVHLPIAFAVLVPLLGAATLLALRRELLPARTWAFVVLVQVLLVGSAWMALETGQDQEERVERVTGERVIKEHEEAAERFLAAAAAGLVVMAAGLLPGRAGAAGRNLGVLVSLGVLAAAVAVGHSGGELVYVHGAANAYTHSAKSGAAPVAPD